MDPKSMTYPALACVLKNLSANTRFDLISICPSLEKVEKAQTMIIKDLDLNLNTITVDGVEYQLGAENNLNGTPKVLATRQLEGRRPPMNVDWLTIPNDNRIIDLPPSFEQFKIRMLSDWSPNNPLLDRFIHPSSLPLAVVTISGDVFTLDLIDHINQQEILKTSVC
ncbi:F-box C protein [Caenorhabditis elegans]|uniref:F-box C protein n=1 Tax=Caenorhabditis elegans TaxID=6239 RepID=Q9TZL5_CAEEL|nr:F-box C protein [Caenorhabditis elegans]CCD63744.1 F-box C protein [Caenorhabditis elegans]|eukprot:NP_493800.3 F-box C protein [Caenorhabditis elegans]